MNRPNIVVHSISVLRQKISHLKRSGKQIGLVPTMGALHEGHLSLARRSTAQNDCTVATIFVNPTQFAADEDLNKYPRTVAEDVNALTEAGVNFVFVPEPGEIYPPGYSTSIRPPEVSKVLEGEFRPTHFEGVCTVVLKLFHIANPDVAYFGQKDFQQVAVIKQMVLDLNLNIRIEVCPIVRDSDGLALSSRNRYLSEAERQIGLSLNQTIKYACDEIESGETDGHLLMSEMRQRLIDAGVDSVDYADVCHPANLKIQHVVEKPAVVLIAAHVGKTRLIDNGLVE